MTEHDQAAGAAYSAFDTHYAVVSLYPATGGTMKVERVVESRADAYLTALDLAQRNKFMGIPMSFVVQPVMVLMRDPEQPEPQTERAPAPEEIQPFAQTRAEIRAQAFEEAAEAIETLDGGPIIEACANLVRSLAEAS